MVHRSSMRRVRIAALVLPCLVVLAGVAACTSTASPGWTFAPPPPSSPPPSGGSAGASASAPSASAPSGSAQASAPASGGTGTVLNLKAQNIAFDQTSLTAPAGAAFQIAFDNEDAGTPHNVAIHEGSPTGPELFKGEIFPGVAKKIYQVPPLKAGTYAFACTVHPSMTGTLTVQ